MKKFVQIVRKLLIPLEKSSIFLLRKRSMNRPIPTLASNPKLPKGNGLQKPEEEVPVKVPVKLLPGYYR